MFSIITPQNEYYSSLSKDLAKAALLYNCLYTNLGAEYSKAYFQKDYKNCSILIANNNSPILSLLLTEVQDFDGVHEFNYYGMPAILILNPHSPPSDIENALDLLSKSFLELTQNRKLRLNYISERNTLNSFEILLLTLGAKTQQKFTQYLNIRPSLEDLKREVRKSYKSLINWGVKNIQFNILEQQTIETAKFMAFKELHIQVAGRQTRSDETWLKQIEMIKNDEAFAILGHLDGKLVTASLFNYFQDHCYYSVSASIRELFDKPLLHSSIWKAIELAKAKGCKEFELGEQVFPSTSGVNKKEIDISYFKRGFGGYTIVKNLFYLTN